MSGRHVPVTYSVTSACPPNSVGDHTACDAEIARLRSECDGLRRHRDELDTQAEVHWLARQSAEALVADIRAHLADAGIAIDPETAAAWWQRAGLEG